MSNFSDQIAQIKSLLHSNFYSDKSTAYSALLHLQQTSISIPSLFESITQHSPDLVSFMITDVSVNDEEIAALALKCLGFMIYHPSLVSRISVDDANVILEAVGNTVMVTKIKSVCNLGMWCLSVQQFGESILVGRFELILRAVVHALDNPAGSLSTTFEAIQAVMKLAAQLSDKMRDSSHIWAPPIYRRLLSTDKKEKDMSERCLLKIKAVILPPSLDLSKVVFDDLKRELLNMTKNLLSLGKKVQTVQAWGWFIRLLGSNTMKNRHLVNEMLKIPEQTFSDHNPQVQIASLVAWEGLIDAFVSSSSLASKTNAATEDGIHQMQPSAENCCDQIKSCGFFKSVKLIMTPIVGIISSKCDTSVRSSCLHTWCYLLHKLDYFVCHPMSIQLVLEPVLEVVFQMGSDSKNLTFWNLCLDLLDDFLLAKSRQDGQVVYHSSTRTESWSLKEHPIKWSAWDVSQMDFFIRMLNVILSHKHKIDAGSRSLVCTAALRVFRSVLKGVQMELKSISSNYNNIMLCLNVIMKFVKNFSEEAYSEDSNDKELRHTSRKILEAFLEELDTSFLDSPIHKVALDCRYIENLPSNSGSICENVLGSKPAAYMDMVSPLVYILVFYISEVIQSTSDTSGIELTPEGFHKLIKVMLYSHDPLEKLCITVGLLYKCKSFRCLHVWGAIASSLKDLIDGIKDLEIMKLELSNRALGHLLSYPFFICSCLTSDEVNRPLVRFHVSGRGKLEFEHVIEVWKSLFVALCALSKECSAGNSFTEELCLLLNGFLDQNISISDFDAELNSCPNHLDLRFLSFFANAVMIILESNHSFAASMNAMKAKHDDDCQMTSQFDSSLGFTARYLKLSHAIKGQNQNAVFLETSRVFSALTHFVCVIHLRETILNLFLMINLPLLQWLSCIEIQDKNINDQIQHLWAEILNCLRRSQPPITFDSSFLKLQAPLLEKTLDHSKPAISDLTIAFWNSSFGEQIDLDYPETLLDVLDKLYRSKRIKLHRKYVHNLEKSSTPEAATQRYKVTTATHNWSSKRVALLGGAVNQSPRIDEPCASTKRKRLQLTEHQKEVRRAQQGKGMDCNGHGPGIRTYTNVDFSQGNDESQEESQDNTDSVLEMLRRIA